MSQTYMKLAEPFTSLRLESGSAHVRVTVFANGANCGTLTFRPDETCRFLELFWGDPALSTYYGGEKLGCVVDEHAETYPEQCLLCENGTLTTAAEVKARAGQGKGVAQ